MRRACVGWIAAVIVLVGVPGSNAKDIGKTPEGFIIADITCPAQLILSGSLHWPKTIGTDPTFSLSSPPALGGMNHLPSTGIHRQEAQYVICTYNGPFRTPTYAYKVERTIVTCYEQGRTTLRCHLAPR